MHEIEAAIGKNNLLAITPPFRGFRGSVGPGHDFCS